MISLGTLGGTQGVAAKVTNEGQVVGDSDLAGDSTQHGFSWRNGVLSDIGTLGGDLSTAKWVNESGEVVGYSWTADGLPKAFRWKNGHMRDLGAVDNDLCSAAWSINDAGQIVGNSAPECDFSLERATLWEKGHVFDLNAFVPADSTLYLLEADFINDRGDITGPAILPSGDVHQYLLLMCGVQDFDGCKKSDKHEVTFVRNTTSIAHVSMRGGIRMIDGSYMSRNRERLRKVRSH
jgi:probable HAF family extracellular repeat protein